MGHMTGATSYRHVIWDWNGTLFNDVGLCADIMNSLLAPRGLPPLTIERYRAVFDFPVIEYYRTLGFDFEKDPFEVVGTEFIERYEVRKHEAALYPGARGVLRTLRDAGRSQSVLSAYRKDTLARLVDHFGLTPFFAALVGLDDHYAAGKLDQGVRLIRGLDTDPAHVILVGDTQHDHEVARAMGIDCVLVDGGHQARERLTACGVPVLDRIEEVPLHLGVRPDAPGAGDTSGAPA